MHTSLYEEVGKKYGLERGDSVRGRDVKHLNKTEYIRKLNKEIKEKEKAIKGLQTMISNLEKERANLNRVSENLNWELMMKKGNTKQIEERKAAIERDLEEVKLKINDKNEKLISVEKELFHKQEELDSMSADVKKAYTIRKPIQSVGGSYTIPKITSKPPTFGADSWVAKQNEMIKEAFKDTVQKMAATYQTEANRQIEEAQKNVIYDYSELHHLRADNQHLSAENQELNSQLYTLLDQFSTPNLRSAVLALANNIINDPNYSSGGVGGDSSDLRWDGRKPGEDEDSFARRCLLYASQQVARNRKKGLHR
jgi:chromosome segregation ATPase